MSPQSSRLVSIAALTLGACALAACGGSFGSGDGSGGSAGAGSCEWEGQTYPNGAWFPSGDGCNSCACENGQAACTLMDCVQECSYNGATYPVGQTFPAGDGCNNCSCEIGGSAVCTTMACNDCSTISTSYSAALDQAKSCDPAQTGQCTQRTIGGLQCGCDTFVNPANVDAIAAAESSRQEYSALSCGGLILCEPCSAPSSGYCSPEGHCVDAWGASCKVEGVVYPGGSGNIPDPFSCNTCSCLDGQLDCTKIACPEPCPAGTVQATQCAQCGPTDACEIVEHACLPACTSTCATGMCLNGVCAMVCG
jgi:hypothetical protein